MGAAGAAICSITGEIFQDKGVAGANFVAVHKLATVNTFGGCRVVIYLPFSVPV